jgi:O-antigen/teichoic acid export membrane protein
MNAQIIVRIIAIAVTLGLVGLYLLGSRIWPVLAEHHYAYLAAALPVICALAVLSPIVLKSWFRQ